MAIDYRARRGVYADDDQDNTLAMLQQMFPNSYGATDDPLEGMTEGDEPQTTTSPNVLMPPTAMGYRQASAQVTPPPSPTKAPSPTSPGDTANEYAQATREAEMSRDAVLPPVAPVVGNGQLPTTAPPPPATRLQPPRPVDRAALYQQLRPYPGMSRSEKLQRMLGSAFHSAAQPGTGDAFKDAARGYAHGVETSLGIAEYDRNARAQYAGQVVAQIAAGEEYWLKYYDKLTEGEKRGAEGQRALAYADYLRQRGAYYEKRGQNEAIDAETKKILAEAARDRGMIVPAGSGVFQGGKHVYTQPKDTTLSAPEAKLEAGKKLVAILNDLSGGKLTPAQQAAIHRAYNGANPPNVPAGSTMDKILNALRDPDQARGAAAIAEIKRAGGIVNSMRPPRQIGAGAGVAAANRMAAGHIGDIIQYNWHRYQNRTTGEMDWPRFISDANRGLLQRDVTAAPGQRNVRDMDLATAIAFIRDRQTPKGVADTATRTTTSTTSTTRPTTPGTTAATFTPQMQADVAALLGNTAVAADEEEQIFADVNELLEGNQ